MKKKTLLIVLGVFFACCAIAFCCIVIFIVSGLSNTPTIRYSYDNFEIKRPTLWEIDEHSTYVNIRPLFTSDKNLAHIDIDKAAYNELDDITNSSCKNFSMQVDSYQQGLLSDSENYENLKYYDYKVSKINGYDVCTTIYKGEISGYKSTIEFNYIDNKNGRDDIAATLIYVDGASKEENAREILETIKLK